MSTSVPSRNRQPKQKNNKNKHKKQDDSSSSSEDDKFAKKVKKVNVTKDFMFDPHVYVSIIDIDEIDRGSFWRLILTFGEPIKPNFLDGLYNQYSLGSWRTYPELLPTRSWNSYSQLC